jgi:ribosomal protein S18 acetylase RimI-like enzyme
MTSDPTRSLLERMQSSVLTAVRKFSDVHAVGPFLVGLDATNDLVWLNYALPAVTHASDEQIAAALPTIRLLFQQRSRVPRFEFFRALWPTLGPMLERSGYRLQKDMPLLAASASDLRAVEAPGVWVELVDPRAIADEELREMVRLSRRAFGLRLPEPGQDEIERMRGDLLAGHCRTVRARIDSHLAGVATLMSAGGVSELVGVGTDPRFRRRGVASVASRFLCKLHFETGGEVVWLSAAEESARRVYARVGFRDVGVQANYVDAAHRDA